MTAFRIVGLKKGTPQLVSPQTVDGDTYEAPVTLKAATGNEIALDLNVDVNKAAGNVTLLRVNLTPTAVPGAANFVDFQEGGISQFSVLNDGLTTVGLGLGSGLHFGPAGGVSIRANGISEMRILTSGLNALILTSSLLRVANTWGLYNAAASATIPNVVPLYTDANTGIGRAGDDQLSMIAGAIEGIRLSEASGHVIQTIEKHTGITAFAGGGQANAVLLLSSHNAIGTCATAGDSAKLPATVSGVPMVFFNGGANACDLFPNTGHTINGLAANTAIRVAPGGTVSLFGFSATGWEQT